jgi:hypothetical protein
MNQRSTLCGVAIAIASILSGSMPLGAQDAAAQSSLPQYGKVSRARIGSHVQLKYFPLGESGPSAKTSSAEGRLAAVDSQRFALELDDHRMLDVRRGHVLSIAVRERSSRRRAVIGAIAFGLLMPAAGAINSRGEALPWQWAAGGAAAGVTLVMLSGGEHWVPTTFPP